MITVLLSILKIIGIVLLCILALILTVLLLILFVPVRYQVKGCRREGDEVPARAAVKITWLLHILNAAFRYPEEPYIKVRIFCFTVFSTLKKETPEGKTEEKAEEKANDKTAEKAEDKGKQDDAGTLEKEKSAAENKSPVRDEDAEQKEAVKTRTPDEGNEKPEPETGQNDENEEEEPTVFRFIQKLIAILKNIKYTICKICDKIKEIIQNIRYYIKIVQSDSFRSAFRVCREEALKLIKSILPGKITGDFVIGLGDPAKTAQILSVQGILYPVIGNHINITPDFERSVFEGDFFIKGKVTVFRVLKTAAKVYFNKDLRKVIRLFKKGGSINGR
ncbi:MAG: DUF2953 domain-containing protein [Lachnospiraceae bacterium]|nr:DUF2953 domain-containing protein [Lachnospiraceae bacterium]